MRIAIRSPTPQNVAETRWSAGMLPTMYRGIPSVTSATAARSMYPPETENRSETPSFAATDAEHEKKLMFAAYVGLSTVPNGTGAHFFSGKKGASERKL